VRARLVIGIAVAAILTTMLVLFLPRLIVELDLGAIRLHQLSPAEQAKAENDVRTTLLQGLGGLALLTGAYLAWRQMQLTRDQARLQQQQFEQTFQLQQEQFAQTSVINQEQLRLSGEQFQHTFEASRQELAVNREALDVDRLAKAVEHIASPDPAVRVVGLHALEQIAHRSPSGPDPIPRILAAFIVARSPWTPGKQGELVQALSDDRTWTQPWPTTSGGLLLPPWIANLPTLERRAFDVYTALRILSALSDQRPSLTLADVDLRHLRLENEDTNFRGIHFHGAHFEGSYLVGVDFSASQLNDAHFEGATIIKCQFPIELRRAHFDGATLMNVTFANDGAVLLAGATLRNARFSESSLQGASLDNADLRGAHLEHVKRASLQLADLRDASFMVAQLQGSDLRGARLQRADLRGANLTGARLHGTEFDGAVANHETVWPEGFDPIQASVIVEERTTLAAIADWARAVERKQRRHRDGD